MKAIRYLQSATREQLLEATALNNACWHHQIEDTGGEDAFPAGYYDWQPRSISGKETVVAFPRYNPATLSADLDRFLAQSRKQGIRVISFHVVNQDEARDLEPSLIARGFGRGGQPRWMALALDHMPEAVSGPEGLRVEVVADDAEWLRNAPAGLPHCRRPVDAAPAGGETRHWRFGAWLGDRPVGHIQLLVTRGPLGVAGLYCLGVVPDAGNQGIELVLLRAACRFARELGCHYAVVDPENEGMVPAPGFEDLGRGRNWWIQDEQMVPPPPSPALVAFVEALGRGDTDGLDNMPAGGLPRNLDRPLTSGYTPLQVATTTGRPASAEWLLRHGATPDLVSLWDLGWKERIPGILARQPDLANQRLSGELKTPLHEAAHRGDLEFARFLLDHGADPTLEDGMHQSTPLGWAEHHGYPELVRLLEDYSRSQAASPA